MKQKWLVWFVYLLWQGGCRGASASQGDSGGREAGNYHGMF